LTQISVVS
jgi:hypothetical protein